MRMCFSHKTHIEGLYKFIIILSLVAGRRERRSIHVPSKHKDTGVSLLVPFVGISVFVFSIIVTAIVIFMKQNRIKLIKK